MKTWGEIKQQIQNAGVKDTDEVRAYAIDLDAERTDFTRIEMNAPVERVRVMDSK